jgi:hypothetical protein
MKRSGCPAAPASRRGLFDLHRHERVLQVGVAHGSLNIFQHTRRSVPNRPATRRRTFLDNVSAAIDGRHVPVHGSGLAVAKPTIGRAVIHRHNVSSSVTSSREQIRIFFVG